MKELNESNIYKYGIIRGKKEDDEPDDEAISSVREWIRANCEKLKHPRVKCTRDPLTSYGWKHAAEEAVGRYVANGEFIIAALREGYRAVQDGNSPNALFNMRLKKAKKL